MRAKKTESKRPAILKPKRNDDPYVKGFKDGVWQQMLVQQAMQAALHPPCTLHMFPAAVNGYVRPDVKCRRCGKAKGEDT